MASVNSYDLGSAEARITINTEQFWRAEGDARQAAVEIEKALNRIVAAVNAIQDTSSGGQQDAMKAQIESLKMVGQQIKLTYETEKQLQSQQHKERMAQIKAEADTFAATHKQRMAEIAAETDQINKADRARRTTADKKSSNPTAIERERAGAQADSLLQVANRNRERARNLIAEAQKMEAQAAETVDKSASRRLMRQAEKARVEADSIEKEIEASVRKINDLRKTARQQPIGMDLQTGKQRDQSRKIREESDKIAAEEERRSRREQEVNARRLFRLQDQEAKAEALRARQTAKAAHSGQPDLTREASEKALQDYANAIARVRAEQQNVRKQLSSGKAQAPDIDFSVDETGLKKIEAEISDINAKAIAVQQALKQAFTPDEVDTYTQELTQLSQHLDDVKNRQAKLLANVYNNTTAGIPAPNTASPVTLAKNQQNTTRLAIAEAVRALGEIDTRFKAARVGLPISIDTTKMEAEIAQAQTPIRHLKTAFADLQVQMSKSRGDPAAMAALTSAMSALESEAMQLTGNMGTLSNSMDTFEARAAKATTGVRGYFNRLRIELERINQDSIGANLQQLGFNLLPMGAVAGLGVKRGMDTAMTLQETEIGFRGITGSAEEARQIMAELAEEAQRFGLPIISSVPEFQKLLPIVSQLGYDIKDFVGLAARLATLNPAQGIEGSVRAISELASGSGNDFVSIAERFNISRSALRQAMEETGKNVPQALEKVLTSYGRSEAVAREFGQTSRAAMTRFKDAVDQFLAEAAEPLLAALAPLLETVTGLFNAINQGGSAVQGITGFFLAATAGAITLTVALGQMLVALEAIKASFLAATLTNPMAVLILGVAAALGVMVAAINSVNQSIQSSRIEAAQAATSDTRAELENLSSYGEQQIEMNLMENISLSSVGESLNALRNQILGVDPIVVPIVLQPEDPVNLEELTQRAISGDASELTYDTRPEITALQDAQANAQRDFARNTGVLVSELSENYFRGIDQLVPLFQREQFRPAANMAFTEMEQTRGMVQFREAYGQNAVTDTELMQLSAGELAEVSRILLGEGDAITQTFMDITANLATGEQNSEQIRDALANSGKLIEEANRQLAMYEAALEIRRNTLQTDILASSVRISALGGINNTSDIQSIHNQASGMTVKELEALSEGLSEFADMLEQFNQEVERTLEDRYRAEQYEIADTMLQRQRTYEDYARNQARAEEDFINSRNQSIADFYAADTKLQEDFEKQKQKITEKNQEQERKSLEDHLRDMMRMARDVDDAIAARDFLSAQKQLQAMRDREEDFKLEAEQRKKDAEEQVDELKKNLEEQRKERADAFRQQLEDAEYQYKLQRQRQDEDFRLSLAREDEDRRIRLWRQQEENRIMDQRRVEDFNSQVRQLIAHNETMRFNQSYWSSVLEQDYSEFFGRIHQMVAAQATGPGTTAQLPDMMGNTGGLPDNVYAALLSFSGDYNAGRQVPGGFIPQYADGVDFITQEGLAYLHYGERVSRAADGIKERTSFIDTPSGGGSLFAPTITMPISVIVNGNMDDGVADSLAEELEYRVVGKMKEVFDEIYRKQRYE